MKSLHLVSIIFIWSIIPTLTFGQFGVGGTEDIQEVKKTETLFGLIENHDEYNAALKDAVKKYWTFTPYRFVNQGGFESMPGDPGLSYVQLYHISMDRKTGLMNKYEYFNLGLFMSQKKALRPKTTDLSKHRSIAAVNLMPQEYWEYIDLRTAEDEAQEKEKWFSLKFGTEKTAVWRFARFFEAMERNEATKAELIKAVQLLNNYCHLGMDIQVSPNNPRPMIEAYNKKKDRIKRKTLLISKEDVSIKKKNNEKALKEIYLYDLKFVARSEIRKAIEEQREDVCYAVIYYEERNMKLKAIIQAKDSEVLYGEISNLKNGIFTVSKKTLESILE